MKNKLYVIRIILFVFCILLSVGCADSNVSKEVNMDVLDYFKNPSQVHYQDNNYVMLNGVHYIDLNRLSPDGTLDKIADNIPYGNPYMADIYGIATDGEYLYCIAKNLQYKEDNKNHMKTGLYKIDISTNEIFPLYEWDEAGVHLPINFDGDYIYFFIYDSDSHQLCRIKKNGEGFEQLTNYAGMYYLGFFMIDGYYYYIENGEFYRTANKDFSEAEMLLSNINTMKYCNGYFYYTRATDEEYVYNLYRIDSGFTGKEELLIDDLCTDQYYIDENYIYYCKLEMTEVGKSSNGFPVYNTNQGAVYVYDLTAGITDIFTQNSELNIFSILNVCDDAVLTIAITNEDLAASADTGSTNQYYVIKKEDNQYYLVDDKTLALVGT